MRVDAHFHIWDLEAHRFPWLQQGKPIVRIYGDSAPLRHSYRIKDYIADARSSGVGAGIYVQCGMEDPFEEVQHVQQLIDTNRCEGFPVMIVGHADMSSDGCPAALERFAQVPNVRGIRYSVAWSPDPMATFAPHPVSLSSDAFVRSFIALGELGLRFDCMLYPAQMHALAMLCEQHPSTAVIVNHTGLPFEADDPGLTRWRAGMRDLAQHPQVSIKISGLGMVRQDWTDQGASWAQDVIEETIGMFGGERCMFASNYPVERLASSFAEVYLAYEKAVAHRSEQERRNLFSENALRLYGF